MRQRCKSQTSTDLPKTLNNGHMYVHILHQILKGPKINLMITSNDLLSSSDRYRQDKIPCITGKVQPSCHAGFEKRHM